MPVTELETPIQLGPWPDATAARLFLSQMVSGDHFSKELPDLIELTNWLNHVELGGIAYNYFKNEDNPQARMAAAHLELAYWAGVGASSIKLAALEQILQRFMAEGIDCTLIKGIAFGQTIYPEHAVRRMNDIDFWIQKKDVAVVWQLLKEMGYQDDGKWRDANSIPDYVSELSFYPDEPQKSKWNMEIHWDLLPMPGVVGYLALEGWWQRRRQVSFQGLEAMVMDPADALVHACTHQIWQHRNQTRLRWLLDIDRLIRGRETYFISPTDWQRVEAEFHDSEIWPAIRDGIRQAAYWFATPLSDQINEIFSKPLNKDQQLFHLFYGEPDMTVGKRMLVTLQGPDSFRYRARVILWLLFPPPKYMIGRYGVSGWMLPFYYVMRIFKGMMSFGGSDFSSRTSLLRRTARRKDRDSRG